MTTECDNGESEAAMFYSHQSLQAVQEERVASLLARSERRRMLALAREAAVGGKRAKRSPRALLAAVLSSPLYGRGKPSYKPSPSVDR